MPPKDVSEPGSTLPAVDSSAAPDQSAPSTGASEGSGNQPASTSVSETQPESAQSKDWLGDAMRAVRSSSYARPAKEAPPTSSDTPEAKETGGEKPADTTPKAEDRKPDTSSERASKEPTSNALTLTPEELERRIQSETDRRLHKFQEEQALLRKKAERAELRKKDPYAYAELEEEEETRQEMLQRQMNEARTLAINSLRAYDTAVLDPLFGLLPEKERKDILEKIEDGIAGRGKAAASAFKVLERTWKQAGIAEARKALLNDQAFVKEVFAKYGNGGRVEPDLVPAAGAATPGDGGFSMNRWIREAAGRRVS